jgi:prepilin-type N-terminal cleavage/methylation domain-containing protein
MKGFTLLEVIAALGILSIALLGFIQGQSAITKVTLRSESMLQGLYLAEEKMTEIERELRTKTFLAMPDEQKGEFSHESLKSFRWKRELERVSIGCFVPASLLGGEGDQTAGFFGLVEKAFENSVRKINVTVEWQEGGQTRDVSLTQLYVDFKSIPRY